MLSPFSLSAPAAWDFHQLQGVDSYVGEFAGDGVMLTFDFGQFSSSFEQAKEPAYVITRESIGGFKAKIVSPKTPGHGITGVYFGNVGRSNKLSVFGQNLTRTEQEMVLRIFRTIKFGGAMPRFVIPPQSRSRRNVIAAADCQLIENLVTRF